MKFSIRDLLWLTAVIGLCIAAWIDRTRSPEIFYLHVYSTRVKPSFDIYHPDENSAKEGAPVRIASISVTPGTPFSAEMPNNYDPTLHLKGKLFRHGDTFSGNLTIGVESPERAFNHQHVTPILLEERSPVFVGDEYQMVVSKFLDPYVAQPGSKPSVTWSP
jgi:hypothetical protein